MRRTLHAVRAASTAITLVALLAGANCDPAVLFLPSAMVVGETDDAVLYHEFTYLENDLDGLWTLRSMKVENGSITKFESAIPHSAQWYTVCDGTYAAWLDDNEQVIIRDLVASTEKLVEVDNNPYGDYRVTVEIMDIDTGRLLVKYRRSANNDGLRIIDLATAAARDIEVTDYVYFAVLDGDYLAFLADPQEDVDVIDYELAARLEVIDLATGEHKVVDKGMRVNSGGGLRAANGVVVWQQWKDGSNNSRLLRYALAEKKLSTLDEDFDDSGDYNAWLVDFDGEHVLAQRRQRVRPYDLFNVVTGPSTLELIDMDGKSKVIASRPGSLMNDEFNDASLVGHYAVWQEIGSTDLVVYDLEAKTTKRLPMFED